MFIFCTKELICLKFYYVLLSQGRFELLSLSGSFTPTEKGGTRDRCGGMSVSLAAADGRVIGGGVAGLLVAASPVQVINQSLLLKLFTFMECASST